jgi:hypothetical protein
MTDMLTTIKCGLPCIARVTRFEPGYPSKTNADPDFCYEGAPDEVEFVLLTTRGKSATCLYKAASEADLARIESELLEYMK